jgi:hypothetical protein
MKLYIAVLDEAPDYMTPTLVAHSMLGAHIYFTTNPSVGGDEFRRYVIWLENSFKKCVVRVNQKEFDKIAAIPNTYLGHENTTLDGRKSCAIPIPVANDDLPNVLKFAKLWKPKHDN